MRFAIIEDGAITNVIEAEEDFALEGVTLVADADGKAQIGGAWNGKTFSPAPEIKPSAEQIAALRAAAYAAEADPLFFKWQRDEADREDWLRKVKEIKARYPKESDQ
jgi:hypothetical protein